MSKRVSLAAVTNDAGTLEREVEAFQSNPEFHGPFQPLNTHGSTHANNHFALIYESREEQLAAAIPFIRQGLERDERCLYITDEHSREDILAAMRNHDIDVDTALESGSLSVHTKQETYLRNGTFDSDEMIAFLADAIDEAREEYEGLRTTGEMAWVLDDETDIEELVEYEAKLDRLLSDEDCVSLCQYNRERFPAEVIRDVINTHPLVVQNGRVSHNVYYTPPEEFFGPDKAEREVDRLLGSLREQTDAKAELHQRERFLRESYQITSNPSLTFEEKLRQLLDLARERMNLDAAGLTHLPEWDGKFLTEYAVGYGDGVVDASDDMWTDPGDGCYCRQVITEDEPVGKADVRGTDWEDDEIHRERGLRSYLGVKVTSGSTPYGTLWVGSTEPREREFSATERTFFKLLGQWVSNELERREHNDAQRKLYEITADPDRSFEEKLDALFDLGCEQFGVELGGLAKVDPDTDYFEVEMVSGDHDHLVPGAQADLSETYCRATADRNSGIGVDDPVAVVDPVADGFEGAMGYEEFGVRTYLGSYLQFEEAPDRTFWFVSTEPRPEEFSEAERAFHNLMGQWVWYELERQQRERQLRERKEHLAALIETTPECIKTVDEDGTLLQMNNAGLDVVEADTDSEVIGECVYGLIAPDDRERFREFNERVCDGERGTLEFDIVGLEGTRRHMETHAAPLHRSDGTTVQVALTRDVTGQVEREREFERALDLLEKTERIADVGGWEIDVETRDVFWTDHVFELLDVSADEEPPLEEALDMYHEEDRPTVVSAVEDGLDAGEPFDVEARIRTASDDVRWLRLQGVPEMDDEEVVSVRGTAQDVTDRKERERELERIERQFEATFNNPSSFMGLLDPDGTVRRINESALEFAGVEEDAVRGEKFWETPWFAHSEEVRAEVKAGVTRAADGEYVRAEIPHQSAAGDIAIIDAMLEPVRDEDGEVVAIVPSGNDITERKEHAERLEQKTDRLESFASMLAHELRNPTMIGQIYSQQLPDGADSEAVEYVTEAFDRIEDIIDVMLVLTRGREAVGERVPVELAAVAREAWASVDALDAELEVEIDDVIETDETYIQHLFRNLLENAVEHGGRDVTVTVGDLPDGFYVADDGDGIPAEEQNAIFDEGYTTAADSGGSGLGLAFVQKLAEAYGWDYTVTESADGGVRFEFTNITYA